MPTDTCVIESREREHEQIATKANAEKEIDKAIKWVREEDKKMDEKYSRGPQPEQSTHYHIVRSLIKALQQAERERDAAVADLDALKDSGFCNSCVGCNAPHSESITYCTDWKRRGLPQDGEGNETENRITVCRVACRDYGQDVVEF